MIDTPGTSTSPTRCPARSPPARARPAGRRRAGHRGADAGQPLPRARERPADHPVLNKIDLPAAQPERYARRARATSSDASPVTCWSQREDGRGCARNCSTRSMRMVPAPVGDPRCPRRAMIFDSVYRRLPRRGHLRTGHRRAPGRHASAS
jgi:hypothetical protein